MTRIKVGRWILSRKGKGNGRDSVPLTAYKKENSRSKRYKSMVSVKIIWDNDCRVSDNCYSRVQRGPCHYAKAKATATSQSQSQSSPHISHVCCTYMLLWDMEHCIVGIGRVFTVQLSLQTSQILPQLRTVELYIHNFYSITHDLSSE